MPQECHKSATRVPRECHESATRVPGERRKSAMRVTGWSATTMPRECHKSAATVPVEFGCMTGSIIWFIKIGSTVGYFSQIGGIVNKYKLYIVSWNQLYLVMCRLFYCFIHTVLVQNPGIKPNFTSRKC